jgi:hypothetical protein
MVKIPGGCGGWKRMTRPYPPHPPGIIFTKSKLWFSAIPSLADVLLCPVFLIGKRKCSFISAVFDLHLFQ